jgi:hypothetical protein
VLKEKNQTEKTAPAHVPYMETTYMKMWKDDGILFCAYEKKIVLDLETAKQCVAARISFSEEKPSLVCIDMTGIKSASKAAREYLANEGTQFIKAGALITDSALTKMLGNIFLSINKPEVPTRMFSDEVAARTWLKKMEYE